MSFTPLLYSSVFFQELAKILPTLFSTAAFIMKRNESYILKHGPLEDCRCPTKPCSVCFFWRDNTAATFNHVLFFILKKLSQSKTNLSFVNFSRRRVSYFFISWFRKTKWTNMIWWNMICCFVYTNTIQALFSKKSAKIEASFDVLIQRITKQTKDYSIIK